jgi:hypothetical protein
MWGSVTYRIFAGLAHGLLYANTRQVSFKHLIKSLTLTVHTGPNDCWPDEILIPEGTTRMEGALVTIEGFELGEHLHPYFEMPTLTCSVPERWHTVKSQVSSSICSYITMGTLIRT